MKKKAGEEEESKHYDAVTRIFSNVHQLPTIIYFKSVGKGEADLGYLRTKVQNAAHDLEIDKIFKVGLHECEKMQPLFYKIGGKDKEPEVLLPEDIVG